MDGPQGDQPTRRRYVEAMRRAIARAARGLADLVDVGRIAAGTFEVTPVPEMVLPLLEEAARRNTALAREAGNWFIVEVDHATPAVAADRSRVLQALDALIENTLRYARDTG